MNDLLTQYTQTSNRGPHHHQKTTRAIAERHVPGTTTGCDKRHPLVSSGCELTPLGLKLGLRVWLGCELTPLYHPDTISALPVMETPKPMALTDTLMGSPCPDERVDRW